MADKPAKQTKRRVKDPETFRERAIKAAENLEKPVKPKRLGAGAKTVGKALKPVTKGSRKLFGGKAFRPLRFALRQIGKVIFIGYLARSWQELKLVTWPSRTDSRRLTIAVLIFAVVFGAAVAGVDWGLDKAFKQLFVK